MQINYNKDGRYEKLYPKTISSNIEMLDGRNLNQWKQDFEDEFNVIVDSTKEVYSNVLWDGRNIMEEGSVTPSKPLSECKNGYVLIFARLSTINTLDNFAYYHVPKIHVIATEGSEKGIKIVLGSKSGAYVQKYLYVNNGNIVGHNSNGNSENKEINLVGIYEY